MSGTGNENVLRLAQVMRDYKQQMLFRHELQRVLEQAKKIIVISGAGISVSAGVPDFRSKDGLFKQPKGKKEKKRVWGDQLFRATVYRGNSELDAFHRMISTLQKVCHEALPTLFHHLLSRLAAEGRLRRNYTQNIDGLDHRVRGLDTITPLRKVANRWPVTIQLHGSIDHGICVNCKTVVNATGVTFAGGKMPECNACRKGSKERTKKRGGLRAGAYGGVRPRITLYDEPAFDDEAIEEVIAADVDGKPDALIVIGTSLKLHNVRTIVERLGAAVRANTAGSIIWVNREQRPPVLRAGWDLIVYGEADEIARQTGIGISPPLEHSGHVER